jgi:hypothetical protein
VNAKVSTTDAGEVHKVVGSVLEDVHESRVTAIACVTVDAHGRFACRMHASQGTSGTILMGLELLKAEVLKSARGAI